MMKLNKRERELLEEHKDRGYLRREDFWSQWTTERTVIEKINRFLMLGIIFDNGTNFTINKRIV